MPPIPRISRRFALLLILAALAAGAYAQNVYRSVMPDGKVVYGNAPEPGAKESKQVNLPPPNIVPPPPPMPANAPAAAGNSTSNSTVAAAQQNLETAKKALEDGREPRDGERIGVAKGGGASSRLTDAYFQRVKVLEDAVTAAQNQLDAAQRGTR
jgi:hypothetical protein